MGTLVLAAGERLKLGGLTWDRSNALIRLAGLPLLGMVLHNLGEAGIREVWIVVGFRGNEIIEEIGMNYAGLKIHYIENPDWEKGNLYSLHAAQPLLQINNFFLCMANHLFNPRILEELGDHRLRGAVALAVDGQKTYSEGDTVVLQRYGKIIDIGKSIKDWNCIDTGFFLCTPKMFEYSGRAIMQGKSKLADVIRLAAQSGEAEIVDVSGLFWRNIKTVEDLEAAKRAITKRSQR